MDIGFQGARPETDLRAAGERTRLRPDDVQRNSSRFLARFATIQAAAARFRAAPSVHSMSSNRRFGKVDLGWEHNRI